MVKDHFIKQQWWWGQPRVGKLNSSFIYQSLLSITSRRVWVFPGEQFPPTMIWTCLGFNLKVVKNRTSIQTLWSWIICSLFMLFCSSFAMSGWLMSFYKSSRWRTRWRLSSAWRFTCWTASPARSTGTRKGSWESWEPCRQAATYIFIAIF